MASHVQRVAGNDRSGFEVVGHLSVSGFDNDKIALRM
jgi:hypothetical protein